MKNIQLLELQNPVSTNTALPFKIRPEERLLTKSATTTIGKSVANNPLNLSDKDLLALCRKYGTQAILWKRKFIGLLLEIDRRELYLKKGCSGICEFAAKFGGVTNEQVRRVISIDKKLAELGLFELRSKLINGEVSLNKLARIVSVANGENEMVLADAMKKLSQGSLETFVKDERNRQMAELLGVGDSAAVDCNARLHEAKNSCENMFVRTHKQDYEMNAEVAQVGGGQGTASGESVRSASLSHTASFTPCVAPCVESAVLRDLQELGLDSGVIQRLKELKAQGRDINKVMNEMLDKREENIAEEKEKTVKKVIGREGKRKEEGKKPVRKISVEVKRILQEEYGTKCAVNGCDKAADHLHHTVPFSINGSNSPDLLKPLCRAHHDIVHSVNDIYLQKKFRT